MLKVYNTGALTALREMADESVQMCVTSPPYWRLRDYGIPPIIWDETEGCEHDWTEHVQPAAEGTRTLEGNSALRAGHQGSVSATMKPKVSAFCSRCNAWRGCLGLEPTPDLYVQHIVQIFGEVRRVLRSDGTLWLNLGDSYSNDTKWGGQSGGKNSTSAAGGYQGQRTRRGKDCDPKRGRAAPGQPMQQNNSGLKPKDLVGVPWMVAFALRADGWYLRSDIIWAKPNPMPESVTDRPTKSHEYVFLLSKSQKYYYDHEAIKEPAVDPARRERDDFREKNGWSEAYGNNPPRGLAGKGRGGRTGKNAFRGQGSNRDAENGHANHEGRDMKDIGTDMMRNKRSVWAVNTKPFSDAHFATFPPDLVIPCILAGSKPGDVVLDVCAGSGTTGKVAIELGRKAVLIEPNPDYVKMIDKRTTTTIGLPM